MTEESHCRRQPGPTGGRGGKLLSPTRRRQCVGHVWGMFEVSERWACRLEGQPQFTQRHKPIVHEEDIESFNWKLVEGICCRCVQAQGDFRRRLGFGVYAILMPHQRFRLLLSVANRALRAHVFVDGHLTIGAGLFPAWLGTPSV